MATHSSILAWRNPWSRQESDTTERLSWTEDATHCWLYTQQSFPVKLPYSCCLLTPTIPSHSSKVTVSPTYPSIFLKNPFLFDFEMPAAFVVSGDSLLQWSFWLKSFWLKSGFFFFFFFFFLQFRMARSWIRIGLSIWDSVIPGQITNCTLQILWTLLFMNLGIQAVLWKSSLLQHNKELF